MDNQEKVKHILAAFNPLTWEQIDLDQEIKDHYVASEFRGSLGRHLCDRFNLNNAKCTQLSNELFESIKTGNDIIQLIVKMKLNRDRQPKISAIRKKQVWLRTQHLN